MIESPLIQELMAQKGHKYVLAALETRFGIVPSDLAAELRAVLDDDKLEDLHRFALVCPNLDIFRERLSKLDST